MAAGPDPFAAVGLSSPLFDAGDFAGLYVPEWSNALCEKRKALDVLGVGAYDNGRLIGLAGCSADCETMWQIGIDVLPEYRRQGVAGALTSTLACEILARGRCRFIAVPGPMSACRKRSPQRLSPGLG